MVVWEIRGFARERVTEQGVEHAEEVLYMLGRDDGPIPVADDVARIVLGSSAVQVGRADVRRLGSLPSYWRAGDDDLVARELTDLVCRLATLGPGD